MNGKLSNILGVLIFSLLCVSCEKPSEQTQETYYTEGLEYQYSEEHNGYFVSNGTNTDDIVNVAPYYNNLPVIGVSSMGFYYSSIKEINLPDSIVQINYCAFGSCKELEKFNFPKSLEIIHYNAFAGCSSLKEIIIPEGVKKIYEGAFSDIPNLEKISFPNSLEYLGDLYGSFHNPWYYSLSNYDDGGYYLGNDENPYLILGSVGTQSEELVVNENCKIFTMSEMLGQQNSRNLNFTLKKIILSDSIEYFRTSGNLINLKEVVGDCRIKAIGEEAFKFCVRLESIPSLDYCEYIGIKAFSSTNIPFGSLKLPSIKVIDLEAFEDTKGIKEIVFGKKLTSIGANAFANSKDLETVYIPKSVKNIGAAPFYMCNNLKTIFYEGTKEDWELINFGTPIKNVEIVYNTTY